VRNKIVTTVAAGIVGATTFAVAPALAASTSSSDTPPTWRASGADRVLRPRQPR
jgi:hypothetical protein